MSLPLSLFHREFDSIDSKTGVGGVGGVGGGGGGGEEREAVEEERREEAEAMDEDEEDGLRSNFISDEAAAGPREHQESPPVPRLTLSFHQIFGLPMKILRSCTNFISSMRTSYSQNISGSVATHSCSRLDLAVG